jgi:hypothetical protein
MRGRSIAAGWAAALVVAAAAAVPARAQDGPLRRFYWDVNRSNREVYVPLVWAFPGRRPADMPYSVSVASWFRQPLGARDVRASTVLDKARYTLDEFSLMDANSPRARVAVVITRTPALPEGTEPPRLDLVHPSGISAPHVPADMESVPGGTRFTFITTPPLWNYTAGNSNVDPKDVQRYEVRLLTAREEVRRPRSITRAPTFGGFDIETRMSLPPPRLPREERVAGRRIEYRSGKVVTDTKK